jgi:hypothetical protein
MKLTLGMFFLPVILLTAGLIVAKFQIERTPARGQVRRT